MKQSLTVFEKYQGIYLLLIHPNEQVIQSKSHIVLGWSSWNLSYSTFPLQVRRWAIDTAKTMKSVDRDAYYDLQEIFSCMFYVIELKKKDIRDLDQESYAGGIIKTLPSHLYDSQNKKNCWLGLFISFL